MLPHLQIKQKLQLLHPFGLECSSGYPDPQQSIFRLSLWSHAIEWLNSLSDLRPTQHLAAQNQAELALILNWIWPPCNWITSDLSLTFHWLLGTCRNPRSLSSRQTFGPEPRYILPLLEPLHSLPTSLSPTVVFFSPSGLAQLPLCISSSRT